MLENGANMGIHTATNSNDQNSQVICALAHEMRFDCRKCMKMRLRPGELLPAFPQTLYLDLGDGKEWGRKRKERLRKGSKKLIHTWLHISLRKEIP